MVTVKQNDKEREENKKKKRWTVVHGTTTTIGQEMQNGNLLEKGGHNMLVYNDLDQLSYLFANYAKTFLPKNEIILFATQYVAIDDIKHSLGNNGVDVPRHLADGTLFIIDAQEGYHGADKLGIFKLATTLVSRAKKEKRNGFTCMADMGSFISFHEIDDLVEYELFYPTRFDDDLVKTVCCYNKKDFEELDKEQQDILIYHHFKSIFAHGKVDLQAK